MNSRLSPQTAGAKHRPQTAMRPNVVLALCMSFAAVLVGGISSPAQCAELLPTEKLPGQGVWLMPILRQPSNAARPIRVTVWFEDQLLGDGESYQRRAKALAKAKRRELRTQAVATLKALNEKSYAAARPALEKLKGEGVINKLERHWVINGFSCNIKADQLDALGKVPGVRKIFRNMTAGFARKTGQPGKSAPKAQREPFDPNRYLHPWYTRSLLADRVWKEFGVTGKGTLNVVHDFNFVFTKNFAHNVYRNDKEIPDNGKDDDGNGLIDDYHGYNFQANSAQLATTPVRPNSADPRPLHGSMCAAIVCGAGQPGLKHEFGIAPEGRWAGVIGSGKLEAAVEWAIEHEADTYSMSFSMPGLGEYRAHWRKVMEHGSLCGIYFVSGAGNFAQSARVPVQMRTPEDIPEVVFAAAGVQRNLSRTPFSSTGPVDWSLEHYREGKVQKPEVCAFNMGLPLMLPNGQVRSGGMNGNSFAGPMFCGSIALMVSADPDLLPWDLKQIITGTAMDVAAKGVDYETGHGLINCYRAVKEVLRRKAVREGRDPAKYEGRVAGDVLDVEELKQSLVTRFTVLRVLPNSPAAKQGVKAGDAILKCAGKPISNMQQFRAAKAEATNAKAEKIAVEFLQQGKSRTIEFTPGNWGMAAAPAFSAPVFK